MRVNYSINPYSKYFLLMDVPIRQGLNHLRLAIKGGKYGLSLAERIKHLALGILKLIPVIGHVATLIDTVCQRKTIVHIKLTSTDPFSRGEEHGRLLKKQIKEVYDPILTMKRDDWEMKRRIIHFELNIPENIKAEMIGLAKGSGYNYEDIVLIHCFLDAQPGQFGCTSMAVKEANGQCQRIAAANHSVDWYSDFESNNRRGAFLSEPLPENGSTEKLLKAAGKSSTIQAMVFDLKKGEIKLASKGTYAAHGHFKTFGSDSLFDNHNFNSDESQNSSDSVKLFHNLDWPWYFLGQETVVLTRPHADGSSTVSVSWPGYIGTLSGINNKGLALAENQNGVGINLEGVPNPLLFTQILDTCSNLSEASEIIEKGQHGSAMNLVIADKVSAKSYELGGKGTFKCVGEITM